MTRSEADPAAGLSRKRSASLCASTALATGVLVALAVVGGAQAQTWNGGSGGWSDTAHWTPATVPNAVDATVTFNATDPSITYGVGLGGGPFTVGTLNLNRSAANSAYAFQLGTLITEVSAGSAAINVQTATSLLADFTAAGGLQLNSNTVITTEAGAVFQVAGNGISGGGGLTKDGPGTLSLLSANSYTGGTVLAAGTLALSGSGTLGATANTTAVSGGTLDLGGTTQTQAALNQSGGTVQNGTINVGTYQLTGGTLAATGTVSASTAFDMQAGTVDGVLAGAGVLTKSTAGTVTLNGANTYTGGTILNGGTIAAGNNSALGTGGVSVTASSGLSNANGTSVTLANDVAIGAGQTLSLSGGVGGSGFLTLTGVVSGATGSVAIAGGQVALDNANAYGGGTTIADGAGVYIRNGGALGTGDVTVTGLGFLSTATGPGAPYTVANNFVINGAGSTLGIGTTLNPSLMLTGNISGAGGLTYSGDAASSLTLTGTNTYGGATRINAGTLEVQGGAALPDGTNVTIANDASARLLVTASETIGSLAGAGPNGSVEIAAGQTLTTGGSNAGTTFGGAITGAGGLTKEGTAAFNLTGTNTYTGATSVNAGTLAIGAGGSLAGSGGVHTAVTVASGATFSVAAGGVASVDTLTVNAGGIATNDGRIQGFGASVNISGTMTSTGTLSDATDINVLAGGTLNAQGVLTAPTVTNAGTLNVTGNLSGIDPAPGPFAGPITTFTNQGGGVVNVNAGTFSGITTFQNSSAAAVGVNILAGAGLSVGTLTNDVGSTITNAGTITTTTAFNNNGTLNTSGTVTGGLTNAGTVNATGGALNGAIVNTIGTINVTTGAVTSDSTFTNAAGASLFVIGGGTYTVAGLITSSGTTMVGGAGAGTLNANGGFSNIVQLTVSANGTLTSATPVSNAAGAVVDTAGTINGGVTNSGTVNATGGAVNGTITNNLQFNVNGAVTGNGAFTNAATGTLAIGAGNSLTGLTNLTNSGTVTNAAGSTLSGTGTYANNAGTTTNNGILTFPVFTNAATFTTTGTVTAATSFTNSAAGTVNAQGALGAALVQNNGQFTLTGALGGAVAAFNNAGTLDVGANAFTGLTNLTNTSTVNVLGGGSIVGAGTYANNAGTTTNAGTIDFNAIVNAATLSNTGTLTTVAGLTNSGTLTTSGIVNGPVTNTGTVNASGLFGGSIANNGGSFTTTGATTVAGGFANNSTLNLTTAGGNLTVNGALSGAGTVRSSINVDTGANLGGTLTGSGAGNSGTQSQQFLFAGVGSGHADTLIVTGVNGSTFSAAAPLFTTSPSPFAVGGQLVQQNGAIQQWFGSSATGTYVVRSAVDAGLGSSAAASISSTLSSISAFTEPASAFISSPADPEPNKVSFGTWARTRGGNFDIRSGTEIGNTTLSTKTSADFRGVQAGVDAGVYNINGTGWSANFGVHFGVVDANSSGNGTKLNLTQPFYGVYTALRSSSGFVFDALIRRDTFDMKVTSAAAGVYKQSLKADGWSGLISTSQRFNITERIYVDPSIALLYSQADVDPLNFGGTATITWKTIESLTGRLGLQIGTFFQPTDHIIISPYTQFSVWHEFSNKTQSFATAGGGGASQLYLTDRLGTYGQASLGLAASSITPGFSGFVRGDLRFGDKINGYALNAGLRYQF